MISNNIHRFPINRNEPQLEVCVLVTKSIKIWVAYKENEGTVFLDKQKVNDTLIQLQTVLGDEVIKKRGYRGQIIWLRSADREKLELHRSLFKVFKTESQIQQNEERAKQALPVDIKGASLKHKKRIITEKGRSFLLTFETIKNILEDIYRKGDLKERSNQINAAQLENTDDSLTKRSAMPERTFALNQSPKKPHFLKRALSKVWSVVCAIFKGLGRFFQNLFLKKQKDQQESNPLKEADYSQVSIGYCSTTLVFKDFNNSVDPTSSDDEITNDPFEKNYDINDEGLGSSEDRDYQTETFRNNALNEESSSNSRS